MSFSQQDIRAWVVKYKWVVALIVVVAAGYTVGKDLALRDNAADQVAMGEV
ncbi:MAG: hypothetical protein AAFW59_02895 [Pseudomonadota bacterium]